MKCCNEKDGPRWGWVVTMSGFWINMFMFGVFRSAGVFYVALMQTFHCSYAEAAWPGSLVATAMCLTGPIAGLLERFLSERIIVTSGVVFGAISVASCYFASNISHVAVLFGGGLGLGIGLTSVTVPILISKYFNRQRATAVGISYCGSTVGAFLFPIFVNMMEDKYAVRGTFLLLGGLIFHGLWGALLLQPAEWHKKPKLPEKCSETNFGTYTPCGTLRGNVAFPVAEDENPGSHPMERLDKSDDTITQESLYIEELLTKQQPTTRTFYSSMWKGTKKYAKIFKNPNYVFTTLSYITSHNVFVVIMIVLPDYAMDRGVSRGLATFLLSAYAASDLIGRLLPGFLSYWKILRNRNTFILSQMLLGVALLLPPVAKTFGGFLGLTLMYGLTGGTLMVLPPVLVAEYVGTRDSAMAYGFSNFFNGAISLLRPLLIDYIKQRTGKYDLLFVALGILNLLSIFLWLMLFIIRALSSYRWCGRNDMYYTVKA